MKNEALRNAIKEMLSNESLSDEKKELFQFVLEALKPRYVLSCTDGFSIDTTVYKTLSDAQNAMKNAYNLSVPAGFDDDDTDEASESYCGENDAILYTGETVYVWDITEVGA